MKRVLGWMGVALLASACAGETSSESDKTEKASRVVQELDNVDDAPSGLSLVVLRSAADVNTFSRVLEDDLKGQAFHAFSHYVVARVPAGSDAILTKFGMVSHFERAVEPSEVSATTPGELRFVRVFDNRYYAASTPRALVTAPKHAVRLPGEPFEGAALKAPATPALKNPILPGEPGPLPPPPVLDRNVVPYASGTVVVSIFLPESNGTAEPSTEDWTEDQIVKTYQKIQIALEAIARSEPNAKLRFILHYESAPREGGMPGTIDSDYEFGQHSNYDNGAGEAMVSAPLLARVLGHDVTSDQVWDASYEYLNKLRAQYGADNAFYVKVAANGNGTAGLRAHAYINGPWTTLDNQTPYQTFMHEFGHIFGATDEYCPDACVSNTTLQGYLGIPNANATNRVGGDGVQNGQGEDQASLMQGNQTNFVNGYTRGAWGLYDADGDGIVDVRDTLPRVDVTAAVEGGRVRLRGTAQDVPTTRYGWTEGERSINRIDAIEYRFVDVAGSPWFDKPITHVGFGAQTLDLDLGALPRGTTRIEVRAKNSVGNVTPQPTVLSLTVPNAVANVAPQVRLKADPALGSTRSAFTLDASALDLDAGDGVELRFDTNGDGVYDTPFGTAKATTARFAKAGVYDVGVEAKDRRGIRATAKARVLVQDGNSAPEVTVLGGVSPLFGASSLSTTFQVGTARDADGDAIEFNWIKESALLDSDARTETGFSAQNRAFAPTLDTPLGFRTKPVDLSAGDASLQNFYGVREVVKLRPNLFAVAGGTQGLWVVDTSAATPTMVSRLALETDAQKLFLDGTRLYVMGTMLTVVDVRNPRKPTEIKQYSRTVRQRALAPVTEVVELPDGGEKGALHDFYASFGERIDEVRVEIDVDHPKPAELKFRLIAHDNGGTEDEIVLRDQKPGPSGKKHYVFTTQNTPALRALTGRFASGSFQVRVADMVAGGGTGSLKGSSVTFKTVSRAAKIFPEASALLGTLGSNGRYLAVAGPGVQVLDVRDASDIRQASRTTSTGVYSAALTGSRVVVLSAVDVKDPKRSSAESDDEAQERIAAAPAPTLRGLYALDLRDPTSPRVARNDATIEGGSLAVVGTRFFFVPSRKRDDNGERPTKIGDVNALFAGSDWARGAFPSAVRVLASLSSSSRIWAVTGGGGLEEWTGAATPQKIGHYDRPYVNELVALGGDDVLFYDGSTSAKFANLRDVTSVLSRVYRVTLEARDAKGAISRVTRAVHLVPYDHAPTVASLTPSGGGAIDVEYSFRLAAADVDSTQTWDPFRFARADLDGDGIFDTEWRTFGRDDATFTKTFVTPGARTLRFQVRDTFGATADQTLQVVVP